jgi:hypothetical protein
MGSTADKVYDVDYYIEQSSKQYKELQRTIHEASRFITESKVKDFDSMASLVLDSFYEVICELRNAFYDEGKLLFLYKHIDANNKEIVSSFLDEALTNKLGSFEFQISGARNYLQKYKRGQTNYNVVELADLMNKHIESSGRLFTGIKSFYLLENKKAKNKG